MRGTKKINEIIYITKISSYTLLFMLYLKFKKENCKSIVCSGNFQVMDLKLPVLSFSPRNIIQVIGLESALFFKKITALVKLEINYHTIINNSSLKSTLVFQKVQLEKKFVLFCSSSECTFCYL